MMDAWADSRTARQDPGEEANSELAEFNGSLGQSHAGSTRSLRLRCVLRTLQHGWHCRMPSQEDRAAQTVLRRDRLVGSMHRSRPGGKAAADRSAIGACGMHGLEISRAGCPQITGVGAGDGDRTRDIQLGKLTFYH